MNSNKRAGPFDGWTCEHEFYVQAVDALTEEVTRALDEGSKFVFMLLGLSRAGKSEVLTDVLERFSGYVNGAGQPRMQYVPTPTEVTRKSLPKAIVRTVIGDVDVDGDSDDLKQQAQDVLEDTDILMLDEVNHWVEARSTERAQTKENRQLADWLKVLHDEAHKSLVLAGLPHSIRVLADNTQLQGRALRPVHLRPYDWSTPAERMAFEKAVLAFVTKMKVNGWEIMADPQTVTRGAYFCGGGLVGKVSDLLVSADELGHKAKRLDVPLLLRAYKRRFPESLHGNPFEMPFIADELLNAAHQRTLLSGQAPVYQQPTRAAKPRAAK